MCIIYCFLVLKVIYIHLMVLAYVWKEYYIYCRIIQYITHSLYVRITISIIPVKLSIVFIVIHIVYRCLQICEIIVSASCQNWTYKCMLITVSIWNVCGCPFLILGGQYSLTFNSGLFQSECNFISGLCHTEPNSISRLCHSKSILSLGYVSSILDAKIKD